ncbi:MAG: flavodoxin family protein [Promethearchaeota archaeon]
MKILAIIGSPRKNGTVSKLAQNILDAAEVNGHLTELINLYNYEIKPCIGDWACVKQGKCHIQDDFEIIFHKLKEAEIVILGSPVYWANISGVMKTFFDRHTGYAMFKPPNAQNFYKLSRWQKIKTILRLMREFGPIDPRFKEKKYILITAATVPFKRIMGEISPTINAMRKFAKKLKGKIIGTLIYTDTLFKFKKNKEKIMLNKAYNLGRKL